MILRTSTPCSGSYYQQAKRRYPKIGRSNWVLLAKLPQATKLREIKDDPGEEDARGVKKRLAVSQAMLKKYGSNGLGEKPKLGSPNVIA